MIATLLAAHSKIFSMGTVGWAAISAVGLVQCVKKYREPGFNKKCAVAMGLFWALSLLIQVSSGLGKALHSRVFYIGMGAVVVTMVVASICLASIGLLELKGRPPNTGRSYAISAIVLSSLIGCLLVFGALVGLSKRFGKSNQALHSRNFLVKPVPFSASC